MRKVVFLDRDGVVNEEVDYLFKPEETILTATIAEAVKLIHKSGRLAVVVTNQAGIAKKMYRQADMESVHARIQTMLLQYGADAVIDAFYFCPHHPDFTGSCDCRKPGTGLLLQAAKDLNIDISASIMVGDKLSDVRCGINAGCRNSLLIATGYGSKERLKDGADGYLFVNSLEEAVDNYS